MMPSVPYTLLLSTKRHSRARFTRPVQREVKDPAGPNTDAVDTCKTITTSMRLIMRAMELKHVVGITLSTLLT
jgi:hypothetical protein